MKLQTQWTLSVKAFSFFLISIHKYPPSIHKYPLLSTNTPIPSAIPLFYPQISSSIHKYPLLPTNTPLLSKCSSLPQCQHHWHVSKVPPTARFDHWKQASGPKMIEYVWHESQKRNKTFSIKTTQLTAVMPSLLWMWIFALHSNNFWIHLVWLQTVIWIMFKNKWSS